MDGHTVMWCVQCAVFSFKIKILHARTFYYDIRNCAVRKSLLHLLVLYLQ